MRYLFSVVHDSETRATGDEMAAIDEFNDRLQANGHWVFGAGVGAPSTATVVDNRGSKAVITDGPFVEIEGVRRGLLGHRGTRPRRGAQAGDRRIEGLQSESRGAPIPGGVASQVDVGEAIARVHHKEWARVVASLTRRFGDLDIAEDAAAEAFATAVERWPSDGVPPNPGAWLTTTANRKAIDRIRRENKRDDKQREAQMFVDDAVEPVGAIEDDRLRLIFTCCHPALATEARVALTLRMVGGLTVAEIARAFLVGDAAMEQRITRAKAKIKARRHPLPGSVRGGSSRARLGCARGPLPRLQRGVPRDRSRTPIRFAST